MGDRPLSCAITCQQSTSAIPLRSVAKKRARGAYSVFWSGCGLWSPTGLWCGVASFIHLCGIQVGTAICNRICTSRGVALHQEHMPCPTTRMSFLHFSGTCRSTPPSHILLFLKGPFLRSYFHRQLTDTPTELFITL